MVNHGLHRWLSGKESTCQCRRHRRWGFDPWVRKIPLEEEMAAHSNTLAQKIPRTEEPWGHKRVGTQLSMHKLWSITSTVFSRTPETSLLFFLLLNPSSNPKCISANHLLSSYMKITSKYAFKRHWKWELVLHFFLTSLSLIASQASFPIPSTYSKHSHFLSSYETFHQPQKLSWTKANPSIFLLLCFLSQSVL